MEATRARRLDEDRRVLGLLAERFRLGRDRAELRGDLPDGLLGLHPLLLDRLRPLVLRPARHLHRPLVDVGRRGRPLRHGPLGHDAGLPLAGPHLGGRIPRIPRARLIEILILGEHGQQILLAQPRSDAGGQVLQDGDHVLDARAPAHLVLGIARAGALEEPVGGESRRGAHLLDRRGKGKKTTTVRGEGAWGGPRTSSVKGGGRERLVGHVAPRPPSVRVHERAHLSEGGGAPLPRTFLSSPLPCPLPDETRRDGGWLEGEKTGRVGGWVGGGSVDGRWLGGWLGGSFGANRERAKSGEKSG